MNKIEKKYENAGLDINSESPSGFIETIKGEIAEKSPLLKKLEKKKGIVSIEFGDEELPIQSIKKAKKIQPKPQKQEIQLEKVIKNKEIEPKEIDIKELEREIKEKKKLLKLKKEEELKRAEQERLRQIAIEQEKVTKELGVLKQEGQINAVKEDIQSVKLLLPFEVVDLKICPKCNFKLKRRKVKQQGYNLIQEIKCKNKLCDFRKEIIIRV